MALSLIKTLILSGIGGLLVISFALDVKEWRQLVTLVSPDPVKSQNSTTIFATSGSRQIQMQLLMERLEKLEAMNPQNSSHAFAKELKEIRQTAEKLEVDTETEEGTGDEVRPPAEPRNESSAQPTTRKESLNKTEQSPSTTPASETETELGKEEAKAETATDVVGTSPPAQQQSTSASNPNQVSEIPNNPDLFDPNLTPEQYAAMPPQRPTKKWLENCAASLRNDKKIVTPFIVLRDQYALGDCIKRCAKCLMSLGKGKKREPNSATMAGMYHDWSCSEGMQDLKNLTKVDKLFEIFGSKPGYVKPDPETIVIHLRLGDVVEHTGKPAEHLLIKGGVGSHPKAKKKQLMTIRPFYEYLDTIQGVNGTKVAIIGGSHKAHLYRESKVYAHCLQRGLARAGLSVNLQMTGHADQDFYFMSHSKRLMTSTGGYSRFLGQMVQRMNGTVIGRWLR